METTTMGLYSVTFKATTDKLQGFRFGVKVEGPWFRA